MKSIYFLKKICGIFIILLSACGSISPSPSTQAPSLSNQHSADKQLAHNAVQTLSDLPPEITSKPLSPSVENTWQLVANNIRLLPPNKQTKAWQRIDQELTLLNRQHNYLHIISQRAELYFYHIVHSAEKRGIPLEIALLPAIESGYDAFAFSQGHAAGLWQFIPSTAQAYGLTINWWYDGRRDVVASSKAAMNYLQALHRRFDGDWLLALAAYNAGGGTINKALRKNRKAGKPLDYWSLELPSETQRYVPRLLALASMLKQHFAKNKHDLPFIAYKPTFKQCSTRGQIDLALAAKLANVNLSSLQELNPGYNRWATAPNGPDYLLIGLNNAQAFEQKISSLPQHKRLTWVRYAVQNGDTLSTIAQKYRTSTQDIKTINQLDDTKIRPKQILLLAKGTKGLYKNQARDIIQKIQQHQVNGNLHKIFHTVKPGDNFWEIAQNYDVNHLEIARWNKRSANSLLRPGEKLLIWKKPKTSQSKIRTVHYTIQKGDSLGKVAKRFGVRTVDIKQWNDLHNKRYIQPGQSLRLHIDVKNRL